jgi:hypothetical protein
MNFDQAHGHIQWAYWINARTCGFNPMMLVNSKSDRRDTVDIYD